MNRRDSILFAVSALLFVAPSSQADVSVTCAEVGNDVVIEVSGTIDLTGLPAPTTIGGNPAIEPARSYFEVGLLVTNMYYGGLTIDGPTSFGPGGLVFATSGSGDHFLFFPELGVMGVPVGYLSGVPLSGAATFAGATLASLGAVPGTYVWTVGLNEITLVVGESPTSVDAVSWSRVKGLYR